MKKALERGVEKLDEATPEKVKPDYVWKFLVAGGIGIVVDTSVLYSLVNHAGLIPIIAKIISTEAAIITIFLINELWTFSEHGDGSIFRRMAKSNTVRIIGLVASTITLKIFLIAYSHLLVGNLVAILVGTVFNYGFETKFTWKIGE